MYILYAIYIYICFELQDEDDALSPEEQQVRPHSSFSFLHFRDVLYLIIITRQGNLWDCIVMLLSCCCPKLQLVWYILNLISCRICSALLPWNRGPVIIWKQCRRMQMGGSLSTVSFLYGCKLFLLNSILF